MTGEYLTAKDQILVFSAEKIVATHDYYYSYYCHYSSS